MSTRAHGLTDFTQACPPARTLGALRCKEALDTVRLLQGPIYFALQSSGTAPRHSTQHMARRSPSGPQAAVLNILAILAIHAASVHASTERQPAPRIHASPHVTELSLFTFFPTISTPHQAVFVEFYTHDCLGCRRLARVWDALASAVAANSTLQHRVLIARCVAACQAVAEHAHWFHRTHCILYPTDHATGMTVLRATRCVTSLAWIARPPSRPLHTAGTC
jgi:hypothetical protein